MKDLHSNVEQAQKNTDKFLVSEEKVEVQVSYISMKYDTPGDGAEADGRNDSSVEN